jgi:Holliday junction resolvase
MVRDRSDLAFALLRDMYGLNGQELSDLDPAELMKRVQSIHQGMSAEHEFAAIASWLGRCSVVTQPDSVLSSQGKYRVPDFLVVVDHNGRDLPFLVEVKSKTSKTLKWSGKYLSSLRTFADLLRMPLLIAWKWKGLWVLVDSNLFVKKDTAYHLTFDSAIKNSLMHTLFGNVWIKLAADFRLELKMKIEDEIDVTADLLPEGPYKVRMVDAGFWTRKGKLDKEDGSDLMWFLLAGSPNERFERVGDMITHSYWADAELMFNLSDVLLPRLSFRYSDAESIDWLAELRRGLPPFSTDFKAILDRALEVGAVQYVFRQEPEALPGFLAQSE